MQRNLFARLLVLLMVAFSLVVPGAGRAMAQNGGLESDNAYISPQFGYSVTWAGDWSARSRDVISNPGGYDTLTLRSDDATLWIQGQGDSETAAEAVQRRILIEGSEDDVIAEDLQGDVPLAEMLVGRDKVRIEGYTLEGGDAVVIVVLSARERNFDDALASVQEQVLLNDSPVLTGGAASETSSTGEEDAVDLTGEATAEATGGSADSEGADEASPEGASAVPANEEDVAEPSAPAAVDEAEDAEPVESAIDEGVFTSTLYDYTFTFDEDLWTVDDEFLAESSDGVALSSDLGSLTIWSWDAYGADAAACLEGESDYYGSEDPTVSDWLPAEDADGETIEGEGDGYAWAVFTLTYTDDAGDETELVDYIECREMPEDDAVVIILASSTPDLYNDHLDDVVDVADTIEIAGETSATDSGTSGEPVDQGGDVETGLSGSLFTSPAYGFTIDIPSQWRIEDERLTGDNEELVLSNGVSEVVIRATNDYDGGDLSGCVDVAAEESGLDLELDTNAEGEPFRAEGRREAYAHYRYTSDDGEEMMYFISCQHIVEGESVLILAQDVPYDEFAGERKFRAELQDAIEMPQ